MEISLKNNESELEFFFCVCEAKTVNRNVKYIKQEMQPIFIENRKYINQIHLSIKTIVIQTTSIEIYTDII